MGVLVSALLVLSTATVTVDGQELPGILCMTLIVGMHECSYSSDICFVTFKYIYIYLEEFGTSLY